MSNLRTFAGLFALPYPAVDACVVDLLDNFTLVSPEGRALPLRVRWRARSAGSSLHQVIDPSGTEVLRAIVRLLPDAQEVVTVVNFQTESDEIFNYFSTLLHQLGLIISQHRQNLESLKQHNVYVVPQVDAHITRHAPSPGRPADPASERAYQRLQSGEADQQVYSDWLKERGHNADDARARDRWRDAYRKAIARRKQSGRTDENK